jgi:hypothetical protein
MGNGGTFLTSSGIQSAYYTAPGANYIRMFVINGTLGTQGAYVEFAPLLPTTSLTKLLSCEVSGAGGSVTYDFNSGAPYSDKSPRLTFALAPGSTANKFFSATIFIISI